MRLGDASTGKRQLRRNSGYDTRRFFATKRKALRRLSFELLESRTLLTLTASADTSPVDLRSDAFDSVLISFSEAIDRSTFAIDDISIAGPDASIAPLGIASVGPNTYELSFAPQHQRGTYTFSIGPDINSQGGVPMDQDRDGNPGEANADRFTFALEAYSADAIVSTSMTIEADDATYDGRDIVIDGAVVTIDGQHSIRSLQLLRGAAIVHAAGEIGGLDLAIASEVVIGSSSSISAGGRGYGAGAGPGAGFVSSYAGGGGYGGEGGDGRGGAGGPSYGSIEMPTDLGSGGGIGTSAAGGRGGGAIRLMVGGTLRVDGSITANGSSSGSKTSNPQSAGGGGSGGSIYVTAGTLTGTGLISANGGLGGNANSDGGGGSGGRIALYADDNTFTGNVEAKGGWGQE